MRKRLKIPVVLSLSKDALEFRARRSWFDRPVLSRSRFDKLSANGRSLW